MKSVNVRVKIKKKIVHAKKIILGIQVHFCGSVINIARFMNISKATFT